MEPRSADAAAPAAGSVTVSVRTVSSGTFTVDVPADTTIAELKQRLAEPSGISADLQRLVYAGSILKDHEQLVRDHNFKSGNTIHLVKIAASAQTQATPARSTAAASAAPSAAAASPFGAPGLNPDVMQSMMSSPMMQALLDNPELMRSMLMSNPGYRQLQETNPEIAQAMLDPAFMRRSMQAMRDPAIMTEMMRQNDRALSNVEAMPGGMNFLNRMYHDVMSPLESGIHSGTSSTPAPPAEDNPFAHLLAPTPAQSGSAPNTEALPNPWAAARSPAGARTGTAPAAPAAAVASPFASLFGGMGAAVPTARGAADNLYDGEPTTTSAAPRGAAMAGGLPFLPGLAPGPGGMDPAMLESMLDNPMMQQAMQQMMSNPELMRAAIRQHPLYASNPAMQQMFDSMLANPELLAQMTNPEQVRASLQMQRLLSGAGAVPGAAAGPSTQPPQERFRQQLAQLADMGFTDETSNIAALLRSNGDVQGAVQFLLG